MIRPVGKALFIQIVEPKQAEGILIIPQAKEELARGIVLGVGEHVGVNVKVNDVVLLRSYVGQKIVLEDKKEHRIIYDTDVMAVEE